MLGHRSLLVAMSGLAALTLSASAFATMSAPNGWYLELNGGSTKLSNKNYPGDSSTSGIGGNANVGYKFMPYFAMEIGYSQYANSTIKDNTGTKAGTDKHYSYDIALKGIVPVVASGLELFAKVGGGRANSHMNIVNSASASSIGLSSSNNSATGLYYGGGMQYYFMPELAVVGQWARAQGSSSTGTMDLLSGGVSFIFD